MRILEVVERVAFVLVVAVTLGLASLLAYGVVELVRLPPLPAQDQPAVLRRLELRLDEPLDKTHPLVGGERYRKFECREVPR